MPTADTYYYIFFEILTKTYVLILGEKYVGTLQLRGSITIYCIKKDNNYALHPIAAYLQVTMQDIVRVQVVNSQYQLSEPFKQCLRINHDS
jgi:hypothetical protein